MCSQVIKDCAFLTCGSADAPIKDIHSFIGTFTLNKPPVPLARNGNDLPLHALPPSVSPLTAENVLWSNTVLAAGSAVGFVVYTGAETRAVMNTSHPETKVGLLDLEINRLSKVRQASMSKTFAVGNILLRSCAPLPLCSQWFS